MRLGFRGRLMLGTTALVVTFVAVAVSVFAVQANDFAERELARNAEAGRKSVLAATEQRRGALLNETRFLAGTSLLLALAGIEGVDQITLNDGFEEIQSIFRAPLLAVVAPDGAILGSRGGGWQPGENLSSMAGITEALRGEASEHVWPHERGLVLVGVAPLVQGDFLLGALVRGELLDQGMAHDIGRVAGRDLILMHDGDVLGTNWNDTAPKSLNTGELAALRHHTLAAEGANGQIIVDGKRRPGLALSIHPDGGIAFLPHDVDSVRRLRDNALLYLLALGLFVVLAGILFATRIARRLTQPLHALMDASQRLRSGELATRVAVVGEDELGRLAQSFNSMAETMQQLVSDVREKATRAEAANRAKDGFLMSISHELRTPLTGIQSTAELLREFGDEASPDERADFLATILTESERLGRRISDALEYATLASDRTQWTVSRVDLFAVCSEARSRLDNMRSLKHVELRIAPFTDAVLRGDRERLTEAVYHVMHNAWQWSPKEGLVNVSFAVDGDDLAIEVADRGPGIPADERATLFDSFTQGGDALTDKPQGIGIGLKIASEVAIAHGGGVDYEDRAGGGARFILRLRRENRPIDQLAQAVETGAAT